MESKIKDAEMKNQHILSLTAAYMLFFSPIAQCVNLVFWLVLGRSVSVDSFMLYGVLLFLLVWSMSICLKRIKLNSIIIPLFLFLAYFVSYSVHPEARKYMFTSWVDLANNSAYWLFINSLPIFLLIRRIWNYETFMKYLEGFAVAAVLSSLITLLIYLLYDQQPGYMYFSYDLLLTVIVLYFGFFKKKKFLYLLGSLLGTGLMFFCGARGPLLCLICAVVIYILFMGDKPSVKILTVLFAAMSALMLIVLWEPILNLLSKISELIGVESRMIEKMATGTLADDSGRDLVRETLTSKLNLFGHGLYGDRVITDGRYTHNLFLELMVQYGLIAGSALCVFIVFLLLAGFFSKDREKQLLFIIFFCSSIVKLMLSSSYLSKEPALFAVMAICVSCYYKDDLAPKEKKDRLFVVPAIKVMKRRDG